MHIELTTGKSIAVHPISSGRVYVGSKIVREGELTMLRTQQGVLRSSFHQRVSYPVGRLPHLEEHFKAFERLGVMTKDEAQKELAAQLAVRKRLQLDVDVDWLKGIAARLGVELTEEQLRHLEKIVVESEPADKGY